MKPSLLTRIKAAINAFRAGHFESPEHHLNLDYGNAKLVVIADKHLTDDQHIRWKSAIERSLASDDKVLVISGGSGIRLFVLHNPKPRIEIARICSDEQLLDFVNDKRVGLVPEYEGQWHAGVYNDNGKVEARFTGETAREAAQAAYRFFEWGA